MLVPGVEYEPIEFKNDGSLWWSTLDNTQWIALSAQADAVYMLFTDSEAEARAAYDAAPSTVGMTGYPIVEWAGTADPVETACYLMQSAAGEWIVANLPDPGQKFFHRTMSATDAADTFAAITDGWPLLASTQEDTP